MKRSEINEIILCSEEFIRSFQFILPPFASWTPEMWREKGHECDEIRDNMLGWDITDWGSGNMDEVGLVLFTLRNGNQKLPQYKKPYAEKLLISQEGQLCPMHFHWNKMEDIINRGGGTLVMQLYCSDEQEELDRNAAVEIVSDGVRMTLEPGALLELQPGQSVTLPQKVYHAFWAKRGTGPVLIGEVSQCNDDESDNRFWQAVGRFPEIEEDVPPIRLLCNEYPPAAEPV